MEKEGKKAVRTAVICVAVLVLTVVVMVGIVPFFDWINRPKEIVPAIVRDGGLYMGHSYDGLTYNGVMGRAFRCGYKSTKRTFEIDDVTLDFGVMAEEATSSDDALAELQSMVDRPLLASFELWAYKRDHELLIKHFDDCIYGKNYTVGKYYKDRRSKIYAFDYAHYAPITLPQELFTEEKEAVLLELRFPADMSEDDFYILNARQPMAGKVMASVHLTYEKDGDKITIQQTEKFFQSKKRKNNIMY